VFGQPDHDRLRLLPEVSKLLFRYAKNNLAVMKVFIRDPYYTLIRKDEQASYFYTKVRYRVIGVFWCLHLRLQNIDGELIIAQCPSKITQNVAQPIFCQVYYIAFSVQKGFLYNCTIGEYPSIHTDHYVHSSF
jgi:hypothetical protein